jgi:hypothetical protein
MEFYPFDCSVGKSSSNRIGVRSGNGCHDCSVSGRVNVVSLSTAEKKPNNRDKVLLLC